ncbi:MAG: hypothetical protein ACP5D9_14065 [Mariniphaga sp.]
MDIYKEELMIEVDEIKELMDLSSNLFNIRISFVYIIDYERYDTEIAEKKQGLSRLLSDCS